MTDTLYTDDPEPADRLPAGLLYVPVRPGPHGFAARMFRTPPVAARPSASPRTAG